MTANVLTRKEAPSNPYRGRWNWWYASIADRMLEHPEWTYTQIAANLGKSLGTISAIASTDLFRSYFAERRRQFQEVHDQVLREKLTKVAASALDVLVEKLDKKRDGIPFAQLDNVAMSALDRLGFSPQAGPSVVVQNNTQNNLVAPSASPSALREAQEALRKMEAQKAAEPLPQLQRRTELDALFAESGLEPDDSPAGVEDAQIIVGDGDDLPLTSK